MSVPLCNVKVITRDQRTVCAISVDLGDRVEVVKLKIQVGFSRTDKA